MPKRFSLKFDAKSNIIGYIWTPEYENPKAVIQISHGMAEHILRYDEFAQYLTKQGFIVIGNDHYAHGESVCSLDQIGVVTEYDFMDAIVKDMKLVHDEFKDSYPNLDFYLFAHSMGSMAAQRYIQLYPHDFQKVVLSGTDVGSIKYRFAKVLTGLIMRRKGKISYPNIVKKLSMDSFAKQFPDEDSYFSWLSSNKEEVKKYEENPFCGVPFPTNYFHSLANLLLVSSKRKNLMKINPEVEILLVGGEKDPVCQKGKSLHKLNQLYSKQNLKSRVITYPYARHECLNEKPEIKEKVFQDLVTFYQTQ